MLMCPVLQWSSLCKCANTEDSGHQAAAAQALDTRYYEQCEKDLTTGRPQRAAGRSVELARSALGSGMQQPPGNMRGAAGRGGDTRQNMHCSGSQRAHVSRNAFLARHFLVSVLLSKCRLISMNDHSKAQIFGLPCTYILKQLNITYIIPENP